LFLPEGTTAINVGAAGDQPRISGSDIISQDINGEVPFMRVLRDSDRL